MNSEFSPIPPEELEAQITALLVGELSEKDAAALRARIAADAELRKLHARIGMTIGLVKQAIDSPPSADPALPEGLKLSGERRETLLASFKVASVPRKEIRIDFRTWGALAAMIAGLLSFTYWMMEAVFVKARFSAQQMAAFQDDAASLASAPRAEPPSFLLEPEVQPAREANLLRRSTLAENASQDLRLGNEVDRAANAPVAGSGSVEDSRLSFRYGIELPKITTTTESKLQDLPSGGRFLQNPAPSDPPAQNAGLRGFFDQPAPERTTVGLADAVPATPSALSASDLEERAWNPLVQTQNVSVNGVSGLVDPGATVALQTGAMWLDGELLLARPDSTRLGPSLAAEPSAKREIAPKEDKDAGRLSSENLAQLGGRAEDKLAAASNGPSDRSRKSAQPKKAPGRSVTEGEESDSSYDPLAFYRRNPELMKRYFPQLYPTNRSQPQLQAESANAGRPVTGEVGKLRRDVKMQEEIRDTLATRILQEKADATIPKSKTVVIIDPAEAKELTFWERIRGAERTALIEKGRDTPDIAHIINTQMPIGYDPYFIQTEYEKIKSDVVLGAVVDKLNLTQEWGDKTIGERLEKQKAVQQLRKMVSVEQTPHGLIAIKARSRTSEEAAIIANAVAEAYSEKSRVQVPSQSGIVALEQEMAKQESTLAKARAELQRLEAISKGDVPVAKPVTNAPVPQPEVVAATNPFSTFSLNVSDVSFKLAAASLEKGVMPEASGIRSEEFLNAFDYHDPAAVSAPVAFAWDRARYPFAHDRDLLRFSVKTAANGREAGRPLNLVLLLDSSGSMERADRVRIIQECLRVLAGQLQAQDKVSVVTFARTPRLWVDGLAGNSASELVTRIGTVIPEGGTNLEEAMRAGYETAARHFVANGVNRVVLLTDGAANLGEVNAEALKQRVEENRRKGIALDCFGIGWEGLNDDLLEQLSRNGDGRYGFVNTPEAATAEFAGQLAGALKVAASDVKVQIEFNPKRTTAYRQIGYAKHQLTQEQFRDNTVDAAEIGAAEAGNALYVVQTNPAGEGPIATVRVRFKVPGTTDYREHAWAVPYDGTAKPLEQSPPNIRLAAAASGFSEWLAASPYAGEITPDRLLGLISTIPGAFPNDSRPKQLESMIRQAKSIAGQ